MMQTQTIPLTQERARESTSKRQGQKKERKKEPCLIDPSARHSNRLQKGKKRLHKKVEEKNAKLRRNFWPGRSKNWVFGDSCVLLFPENSIID